MAGPQSDPLPFRTPPGFPGSGSEKATAVFQPISREEILALGSLKQLISRGEHGLDWMLFSIADAARRLTGASGAAIAMWKDGLMVCRARSGDTAPELGAQLSVNEGISGECLRTGQVQHCSDVEHSPLVNVEVCRNLGLRSIAVLPVKGWRGVNGILEVFSTLPGAFSGHELALLNELTSLAELARASRPHGASQSVAKGPAEEPPPSGLLPASDPVGDVALAAVGGRSRRFLLGAIGAAAIGLIALVIWLGWKGADWKGSEAHAAPQSFVAATVAAPAAQPRLPDNDPVWQPNPGGEMVFASGGKDSGGKPTGKTNAKPSAGFPVKLASKTDVIEGKKTPGAPGGRSLLSADAANVALPRRTPASDAGSDVNVLPAPHAPAEETISIEAPSIAARPADSSRLNGVLSAEAPLPALSVPVSQGVSGGQLLHRVPPVYPAQAKSMHVEGRVVLSAMVSEDGRVGDVKVVEGPSVLAPAAVEAVKAWKYRPFLLDGKPVKRETKIMIDFKLP